MLCLPFIFASLECSVPLDSVFHSFRGVPFPWCVSFYSVFPSHFSFQFVLPLFVSPFYSVFPFILFCVSRLGYVPLAFCVPFLFCVSFLFPFYFCSCGISASHFASVYPIYTTPLPPDLTLGFPPHGCSVNHISSPALMPSFAPLRYIS